MAIKIAITNQKGGVGKTTTAINLADALKHIGYRVLLIDLDPQSNSTSTYQAVVEGENTIYDLMSQACDTKSAIQHTEMGDIIAGDTLLTELESKLITKIGGYNVLKKALRDVEDDYDYIIMDTPPNLGVFMLNALTAANGCIVPIKAEVYAVDGLNLIIKTVNDVIENTNPELNFYGVMLTAYDVRNGQDKAIWEQLPLVGEQSGFRVFKTPIRICQDVKKAQSKRTSLFEISPACSGSVDYAHFVKELLEVI